MKLETRLMSKFMTGVFLLALLLVILFFVFYSFASELKEEKQKKVNPDDFMKTLVSSTQVNNSEWNLDRDVKAELKQKGDWIQILDQQGQAVLRFNTPRDVPRSFSATELVQYKDQADSTGYDLYTWYRRIGGEEYTWLLGRKNAHHLLQQIKQNTEQKEDSLYIPPRLLREVKSRGGWVQILDDHGREIYQYARPRRQQKDYSPGTFVQLAQRNSDMRWITGTLNGESVTWVYNRASVTPVEKKKNRWIALFFYISVFAAVAIFGVSAYRFGKKLGRPLLFILDWLRNLSNGNYQAPDARGLNPVRDQKTGELKRPLVVYREVIHALEELSGRLREIEEKRHQLDQTREAWLAGVSHDLKTPLSTIKGYADLYMSPHYQWSVQEMEQYLALVVRKSDYIQHLIEDMKLTFQIKNQALLLQRAPCDMKEFIRMLVAEVISESCVENPNIQLVLPEDTTVMYWIDFQWFKRALVNLLMNALVHNPPDTQIMIKLQRKKHREPSDEYPAMKIVIQDTGRGMDEKTLASLFNPYKRGSRSTHPEGTGLGMTIAKQLIQLHHGHITVNSKLNKGTTVQIDLPSVKTSST